MTARAAARDGADERVVLAAITSLRDRVEAIRAAELARAESKIAALSAEQRRAVEEVTARIVDEFLREPTVRVTQPGGEPFLSLLRELFDLEEAA